MIEIIEFFLKWKINVSTLLCVYFNNHIIYLKLFQNYYYVVEKNGCFMHVIHDSKHVDIDYKEIIKDVLPNKTKK